MAVRSIRKSTRKRAVRTSPRARMLAVGRELAETRGIDMCTAELISAEVGLKPATFTRTFGGRDEFLVELMEMLADEVRESLAKLTLNMAAGLPRMKLAIDSYLGANVERPVLRELMNVLRARPPGAEAIRRRASAFTLMIELELKSMKWPRAAAAARLITAAITEISLAEHEAGSPLPEFRATLYAWLHHGTPA